MKRNLQFLSMLLLMIVGGASFSWAGDFIDDATSITIKHSGAGSSSTITPEIMDGKKVLKFTPTTDGDAYIEFEFSGGYSITPGQTFGVIEAKNIKTTDKNRFRYFTIDGNELEDGGAGSVQSTENDGNTVVLCNFMHKGHGTDSKNIPYYFANHVDNTSLKVTKIGIFVGISTANTETVITTVSVRTLGEILKNYEGFCTSHDWQYISVTNLRIEMNGTNGNTIKTKDTSIGSPTVAQLKLFIKSLGLSNLPSAYTNIHLRYLDPSEIATEDLFSSEFSDDRKLLLNFEYMYKMPTLYAQMDQFDQNQKFYVFYDGTAPTSVTPKHTTNGNWGAFTREFKAGYNSMMLPMKYLNTYDTDNISFYKVSSYDDGRVTFEKISADDIKSSGKNWKEEPLIVHANRAGLYTFVGRDADNTLSGYKPKNAGGSGNTVLFVGSYANEVPSGEYEAGSNCVNYGITSDGTKFAKMAADTKTTYYRAFLCDKRPSGARALTLSFDDGEGTAEIVNPEVVDGLSQTTYYDLQGRHVTNPTKGLYIVNGKKVFIK